jgi:hypothetical protein
VVKDGDAVIVPAGTYHNVINTSKTAKLKLYTIYSPPNHPDKTVHKTKAEGLRRLKEKSIISKSFGVYGWASLRSCVYYAVPTVILASSGPLWTRTTDPGLIRTVL